MESGPTPIAVAQEALWYVNQLAPGNPVYNESVAIHKDGPLNVAALREALEGVVRRHELWRSTFSVVDDAPVLRVNSPPSIELPLLSLERIGPEAAEHEAARAAGDVALLPFDLERGPLLRPLLIRFSADRHRLYLCMHHIIFDALSLSRVVLPELISLYNAFAAGLPSPLDEVTVQYSDYVRYERSELVDAQRQRRLGYWRQHLAGAPTAAIPTDGQPISHQPFRGAMESVQIRPDRVLELELVSRRLGATLFQTLAGAFSILMQRSSGLDDVVFATVVDLRPSPAFERMVGFCLTPLVLRVDLGGDPTFAELVARVRDEVVGAMDHKVPFQRLVTDLQPLRTASSNPIFQTMIMLEPPAIPSDPSWSLHPMQVELGNRVGHSKWDMYLELDRRPDGGICGRLIYNRDLFERDTARRTLGHWETLLDGIAQKVEVPISELAWLTEAEKRREVTEWNQTTCPVPQSACLHELVAAQATASPDAIAVSDSRGRLTYAEMEREADRLARHLQALGVGPGRLVGVCLERSCDLVVSLLAILKTGGAYVPLEPDQPPGRWRQMVEDSRPLVVVSESNFENLVSAAGAKVVLMDDERAAWSAGDPERHLGGATPADLAYVLYTSGSTGRPKGVMIEHHSIVNQLVWRVREFGLGPGDRVLQKTPIGFDVSLWELFCPLICGATVVMLDPGAHRDPRRIAATVRREGVTALHFVPSMLSAFHQEQGMGVLSNLRLVATSGEQLTPELAHLFFQQVGEDVELVNLYGPTEATVDATFWRCNDGELTVPLGRPVANTSVYLLDRHLQPVPIGVTAEIYIGGAGVGRGYLNQPEQTALRFLDDPFQPGQRLYRTGDLGRRRSDGAIEYLGRVDDQIKVHGVRIEPGEVEAALLAHPGVCQAAVVARPDASGENRLLAYLVSQPQSASIRPTELREHLARRLPSAMIPSRFTWLERMPVTSSGKLDRRALLDAAPIGGVEHGPPGATPPASDLQRRLLSVWESILTVRGIGVSDDFFNLGGHSLMAVRLLSRVERELGYRIALDDMLEVPFTVAGMAAVITGAHARPQDLAASAVHAGQDSFGPVFFIYPDESSMVTMRHFVSTVGRERRVVALLPERDGRQFDLSRSIQDLAEPIRRTIRRLQPGGSYYIGGYSLGGMLAYEVAGALAAEGADVRWLGILDGVGDGELVARVLWLHTWRGLWRRCWERAPRRELVRQARSALAQIAAAPLARFGLVASHPTDDFDWRGAMTLAVGYEARRHAIDMDLFVSRGNAEMTRAPALGWDRIHQGAIRLHSIPGDHLEMVREPQVHLLTEALRSSLREARLARTAASA
ncbi:MAG: non-ribosomal peptide synthetase [Candidatus Dormibacteria bacterium]